MKKIRNRLMMRRFRNSSRKTSYSNKQQNRKNLFLIAIIVTLICGAVVNQGVRLKAKSEKVQQEYDALVTKQQELDKEQEELKDKEEYMQTKKYIEEVAREKLGLVYPGEIVFQPEE